jgi:hypothetical protein
LGEELEDRVLVDRTEFYEFKVQDLTFELKGSQNVGHRHGG